MPGSQCTLRTSGRALAAASTSKRGESHVQQGPTGRGGLTRRSSRLVLPVLRHLLKDGPLAPIRAAEETRVDDFGAKLLRATAS